MEISFRYSLYFSMVDIDNDTDLLLAGRGGSGSHPDAALAAAERRLVQLQDALSLLNEYASEKRSAKREAALRRLFKALSQYATGLTGQGLVEDSSIQIQTATLYAIRSGQPAEQYAACRVLEATSVILGADCEEWCEQLQRPLQRVIETTTRAVPVRIAALRALSMSVFINCVGETEKSEAMMDLCEQIAAIGGYRNENPVPVALRATALDCWALLGTTISNFYLAGKDDFNMGRGLNILALLKDCLDDSSVDLRSAAGECMTLIHEARLELGVAAGSGADGDGGAENVTARRYRRGSWDGTEWEVLMDEVKQRIAELAVESGHHMSKKAKKEQRATFREFMNTIVDDEAPEEVVHFRGGNITLTNWKEIIQLNFVRHCLQGGFQIQLLTNSTLQEIFGINAQMLGSSAAANLSQLEKRLLLSKTSEAAKNADMQMTRDRRKRQNIKNHFLTADGEDI